MKLRFIGLSLVCVCAIHANGDLGVIDVEGQVDTTVVKDVRGEDIKSADLGEALSKEQASINISRRSGIANDILIRGQKKDNIVVTVDGAKVCGACPNRMDPPISHILTNNIDYIEVNEGPFDVSDFGSLAANVKVHTLKPKEGTHGEVTLGAGSWDYKKGTFLLSGGNDKIKYLLSTSKEDGGMYKDGNGDDFVGQIENAIAEGKAVMGNQYQTKYQDMDAFSKKTLMGKLFWNITDNQELSLGYTANRSDNVLYPNTPMDAIYDNSNIFNVNYTAKDLGVYSKKLTFDAYRSTVDHPMSTQYRNAGSQNYMTSHLETEIKGAKLTNTFDIANHEITAGIDTSKRNWDGRYYKTKVSSGAVTQMGKSIDDVDTTNIALFAKDKFSLTDNLALELGVRADSTDIDKAGVKQREFNDVSGYIFGKYSINESTQLLAGIGRSNRVPDAKELYLKNSNGTVTGNPNLDNVTNNEIDLGVEKSFDNAKVKSKLFYSKLDNYIAYNATSKKYENVDASLYGFELGGSWYATEKLAFDGSIAYQRGKKENPLANQTGTNMPDIAPFKAIVNATYSYDDSLKLEAQMVASAPWSLIDSENGEQKLDSYEVVNLKATKAFANGFELSVGVDNLFDTTYITSNSYKDLTLLASTTDMNGVMLLNEPGRYFYTQLKYKF